MKELQDHHKFYLDQVMEEVETEMKAKLWDIEDLVPAAREFLAFSRVYCNLFDYDLTEYKKKYTKLYKKYANNE